MRVQQQVKHSVHYEFSALLRPRYDAALVAGELSAMSYEHMKFDAMRELAEQQATALFEVRKLVEDLASEIYSEFMTGDENEADYDSGTSIGRYFQAQKWLAAHPIEEQP